MQTNQPDVLRIIPHIENLLLNHDCIVLPGLGGFITRFDSAFVSDDGKEIFPPYRSVSFNTNLRDDDGLLTQSYMTTYDTSYPKAQTLVKKDIKELQEELEKNQEFQIGTIGKLQLTLNRSLIFTPSSDCGIFAKQLYGLVQWAVPQRMFASETEQTESRKEQAAVIPLSKNEEGVAATKPHSDDTHYVIRISKKAVHYTASGIAAALIYLLFTIAPPANNTLSAPADHKQEAAIINVPQQQKHCAGAASNRHTGGAINAPAAKGGTPSRLRGGVGLPQVESSMANAQPSMANGKPSMANGKPSMVNGQWSTVEGGDGYTLVIASKVSVEGAKAMVAKLSNEGFSGARVIDDDGMTRVIYSSYPSEDKAYEALHELRPQHKRFKSAWVMKIQ